MTPMNDHSKRFIAWAVELGHGVEDGLIISAWDHETAARQWAEEYDRLSADYSIAGGSDMVVTVKDIDSVEMHDYNVSGETVPLYRARKEIQ